MAENIEEIELGVQSEMVNNTLERPASENPTYRKAVNTEPQDNVQDEEAEYPVIDDVK